MVANMNEDPELVVVDNKITREKWSRRILNKDQKKTYKLVFDKRIILDNGVETVPYGYYWTHHAPTKPPDSDNGAMMLADKSQLFSNMQVSPVPTSGQVSPVPTSGQVSPVPTSGDEMTQSHSSDIGQDLRQQDDDERTNYVAGSIDLMNSSSESESDIEPENEQDREFIDDIHDDEDMDLEDIYSFYRALDNDNMYQIKMKTTAIYSVKKSIE